MRIGKIKKKMEKTPEEKRKLSVLESDPLSLSLAEFKEELDELQSPNRPVIDYTKAADLENKRRLAIHADNNKRSYHRGKERMDVLGAEIKQLEISKKELEEEKRFLQEEIQYYLAFHY